MSVILRGERLTLSLLNESDITAFVAYRQHPEVARFQSWTAEYSPSDAAALVMKQPPSGMPTPGDWSQWGVRLTRTEGAEQVLIGDVGVGLDDAQPDTYELGVTLAREHQGLGYAAEALRVVIDWLMGEHGAHRIVMRVDSHNASMLVLAPRVGLRCEGAAVDGDWFKGEWSTLEHFAVLRGEWLTREG